MNSIVKDRAARPNACLHGLLAANPNPSVRAKLNRLHEICRKIVLKEGKRLTLTGAITEYNEKLGSAPRLPESSVRNKRPNGNPYMDLYRAWAGVAQELAEDEANTREWHTGGEIVSVKEIMEIEDVSQRTRLLHTRQQYVSVCKERDLLKKAIGAKTTITVAAGPQGPTAAPWHNVHLTKGEIGAMRSFVEKLGAGFLVKTPDDGVRLIDGRYITDPGFVKALMKVLDQFDNVAA